MSPRLNLTQHLVETLGASIVAKRLPEAQRSMTEKQVCERFGVSRSITREALTMLASKGLLFSRMSQGTIVLPEDEWNLMDKDVLRWMSESRLSLQLRNEIAQFRYAVEPTGALFAAKRLDKKRVVEFESQLTVLVERFSHRETFLNAKVSFHQLCLAASNNKAIQHFTHLIEIGVRSSQEFSSVASNCTEDYLNAHREVINNIVANKPYKAKLSMEAILSLNC